MRSYPMLCAALILCASCTTVGTDGRNGTEPVSPEQANVGKDIGKAPALKAVIRKAELEGPTLWYRPVEISVRRAGATNVDGTAVKLRVINAEPAAVPFTAPSRVFHPADGSEIVLELPPSLVTHIEEVSANVNREWDQHVQSERTGKRTGSAPDWADFWDYQYLVYVEWSLALKLEFPATGRPALTFRVPLGPPMRYGTAGGTVRKKPGLTAPPKSMADFGPADAMGRAPLARGLQLEGLDDFYER